MDDQGIAQNNERHESRLKQCKDWENAKASNKIKQGPVLIRKIEKGTINKKQQANKKSDLVLAGLNPVEKFKAVLTKHKELTRQELRELTGLAVCTISRSAKILEEDGFLTRGPSGTGIGREVLFSLALA